MWLVLAFFYFKEGFVRHDLGHSLIPFEVFLGALLAVPWTTGRRVRAVGFVAIVLPFLVVVHSVGQGPGDLVSPVTHARAAWHDANVMFSPRERRDLQRMGRTLVKRTEAVPFAAVRELRGRTTWIFPFEEAVAWAYRLRWRPAPTFQNYVVDTRRLDSKNAARLTSERPCRKPQQTTTRPGSTSAPRALVRYSASSSRSSGRPRGSP